VHDCCAVATGMQPWQVSCCWDHVFDDKFDATRDCGTTPCGSVATRASSATQWPTAARFLASRTASLLARSRATNRLLAFQSVNHGDSRGCVPIPGTQGET